ncbi:MAG: cadmium-translocating P-type ATPase [Clostridium sp.]|jgi:Cd2+/Zn2+-exporting ATPase|nr:cadmium-translocating P-type ATPase [Clostridium sp.]OKZ88697.1 MAG: cadmium-translocating P-type ATPase [Clostridium sp. CAG:245_30_32]CDA59596.1 heavy metal translocating P-type ATPase [Clostridium sp. CAG:245]
MKKYEYEIAGLDCAACANEIQEGLNKNSEIKNANVNFAKMKLTYETDTLSKEGIEKIVQSIEPEVELLEVNSKSKDLKNEKAQKENRKKLWIHILRLVIGAIVAGVGLYIPMPKVASTIFIVLGYAVLLFKTVKNAVKLLFKSKTINENLLITISCIGAYLVGKSSEGLMVIILYEIGKILEEKAINKTRKSISDLMDIKPEYANLKKGDEIEIVEPSEVKVGDIVVAKQGEKIPLDGVVVKGTASLNTASLTGESKPQDVDENDIVLSGSIVLEGLLEIKVTEKYENSTVSKILELVENATDKKAKTETFVNKAAKIYTPIVIGIAILVGIFLPLISNVTYGGENGSIYRALIFLVISCPCAIAISVPLCYFSGIGKSSKEGILIKGSDYLDELKDVKEIVFDKTGTLTKGQFGISKIEVYSDKYVENDVLKYVVWGESYSNHPIAKSIVRNAKNVETKKVENYEEITGKGIKYNIDGKTVLAGNSSLVGKEDEVAESTKIYLKIDDELVGAILLKDEAKHGTKEAIQALNSRGIVTKMFTGDNKKAAKQIAEELGISEFEAEMLPDQKYSELEKELEKYKGTNGKVAFVGDGINDSPVLARADVGISMGGVGSGSAIEASDIVVMTDSIDRIDCAIDISKKTSKIIKQNLIFSIGVKIIVLVLSVFGVANMWEAVFADVGATLITVLNSLRILK